MSFIINNFFIWSKFLGTCVDYKARPNFKLYIYFTLEVEKGKLSNHVCESLVKHAEPSHPYFKCTRHILMVNQVVSIFYNFIYWLIDRSYEIFFLCL